LIAAGKLIAPNAIPLVTSQPSKLAVVKFNIPVAVQTTRIQATNTTTVALVLLLFLTAKIVPPINT
jgi:hypothetical protein